MKTILPHLLLMLSVIIILIIVPVYAGEVSVTFDESRLHIGQEVGNTYSDLGITFSQGVKIVDTDSLWLKKDLGIWDPENHTIQINFSPSVRSVSIDFKDSSMGNINAFLVNGRNISESGYKCTWITKNGLKFESNDTSIESISILNKPSCAKKVKINNLYYEQIPGASENSSCGNCIKPDKSCTEIPEFPSVALPVAAVLGMLFIFKRRKN
jgi:hypothetical protein